MKECIIGLMLVLLGISIGWLGNQFYQGTFIKKVSFVQRTENRKPATSLEDAIYDVKNKIEVTPKGALIMGLARIKKIRGTKVGLVALYDIIEPRLFHTCDPAFGNASVVPIEDDDIGGLIYSCVKK